MPSYQTTFLYFKCLLRAQHSCLYTPASSHREASGGAAPLPPPHITTMLVRGLEERPELRNHPSQSLARLGRNHAPGHAHTPAFTCPAGMNPVRAG